MAKQYIVSDGKLMLALEPAEEGGYNVTSPLDPQLITQAETLEEAFANAYDARQLLIEARAEMARESGTAQPTPSSVPRAPTASITQSPAGQVLS